MPELTYTKTNYRKNIVKFLRQFDPDYSIPKGYHVHHIVPKSEAKRLGWTKEQINHPSNLMVLSPEDHIQIHIDRGDKITKNLFLSMKYYVPDDKHRDNISKSLKGRKLSESHLENRTKAQTDNLLYKFTHKTNVSFVATRKRVLNSLKMAYPTLCNMINHGSIWKGWTCVKIENITENSEDEIKNIYKQVNYFQGWYVTPFGKFTSTESIPLPKNSVSRWCHRPDRQISLAGYSRATYLQSRGSREFVTSKTYRDLGFWFEEA